MSSRMSSERVRGEPVFSKIGGSVYISPLIPCVEHGDKLPNIDRLLWDFPATSW